uniref:EGF-like domain-containing protein n=1 Tax=Ciona savignyi TaxID=51511 RepID=H2Y8J8_CIOSA
NLIFWTNWNEHNASVSRATTSGQDIRAIIRTSIKTPNALTIDIILKELYWADASLDKIERCDFNGGNRQVLISSGLEHIFSLSMLGRWIYWSDWGSREIQRANKWLGDGVEVVRNRTHVHLMGVLAVYDDKCELIYLMRAVRLFAECKYRCIIADDGSAECMCPDGMIRDDCHTVCSNDQFDCGPDQHLRCVAYIYTCDGIPHCSNAADESPVYCHTRSCRDGYWMCGDDKCIEQNRVCDGSPDCADQSDESSDIDCPRTGSLVVPCSFGMFKCTDGKCIPMNWKCDSELDCDDGSDENCSKYFLMHYCNTWLFSIYYINVMNFTCPLGHFQCETSHKCIPLSYHCDADKDCFDGSDEVNCSSNCREDFFSCADNGHCIPNTWVCDGEVECTDGSDELSC